MCTTTEVSVTSFNETLVVNKRFLSRINNNKNTSITYKMISDKDITNDKICIKN